MTEIQHPAGGAERRRAGRLAEVIGLETSRYDRATLQSILGMDGEESRRWWRAMGIVEVPDGVVAFGDDDVQMARRLLDLLAREPAEEHVMRLARLLGGSFSRIAEAQTAVLEDLLSGAGAPLDTPDERTAALADPAARDLLALFERSLVYVWRRHLFATLGRWIGADEDQREQAVGFADISGFSSMSKRMEADDLAEVVERFEQVAMDLVSHNDGRVVKFIGDEVMFVASTVEAAVDIALELGERMAEGEPPIPLHCGIAVGPTVTIGGDVFGHTVNLASRLTNVARKNKVVLPKEAARELADREDLQTHRVPRVFELKGVGRTQIVSVARRRRPEPEPEPEVEPEAGDTEQNAVETG